MEKLTLKAMFDFIRNVNDEDLTAEDRSVLFYYLGYSGENWLSHNSHAAEKTGLCEKTIQKCRRHLREKGIISTEKVYDQQNYQKQVKKHGVKGTRTIVNYWYKGAAETGNQNTGNQNTGNENTCNENTELKDPNSCKRERAEKSQGNFYLADSAERNPYVRDEGGPSPLPPAPSKKAKARKPKKESRKKSPFNPPDPVLLNRWDGDDRNYFNEVGDKNDEGMQIPLLKELRDFIELKIIQKCENIQEWDDKKLNDITEYYWNMYGMTGWDGIKDWRAYLYKRLEQYGFLYELDYITHY
ncbi:hypothetical protein [Succinimonas sp.]|uniref:hypothetical protein n=1 Tax=Succinimonas sp. TaxID=1936151 RepID=UPI0038631844